MLVCMYAWSCIGMYVCMVMCWCVCMYGHVLVCMYVWSCVGMYVCMVMCWYVCMHGHVLVCMYVWSCAMHTCFMVAWHICTQICIHAYTTYHIHTTYLQACEHIYIHGSSSNCTMLGFGAFRCWKVVTRHIACGFTHLLGFLCTCTDIGCARGRVHACTQAYMYVYAHKRVYLHTHTRMMYACAQISETSFGQSPCV